MKWNWEGGREISNSSEFRIKKLKFKSKICIWQLEFNWNLQMVDKEVKSNLKRKNWTAATRRYNPSNELFPATLRPLERLKYPATSLANVST